MHAVRGHWRRSRSAAKAFLVRLPNIAYIRRSSIRLDSWYYSKKIIKSFSCAQPSYLQSDLPFSPTFGIFFLPLSFAVFNNIKKTMWIKNMYIVFPSFFAKNMWWYMAYTSYNNTTTIPTITINIRKSRYPKEKSLHVKWVTKLVNVTNLLHFNTQLFSFHLWQHWLIIILCFIASTM